MSVRQENRSKAQSIARFRQASTLAGELEALRRGKRRQDQQTALPGSASRRQVRNWMCQMLVTMMGQLPWQRLQILPFLYRPVQWMIQTTGSGVRHYWRSPKTAQGRQGGDYTYHSQCHLCYDIDLGELEFLNLHYRQICQ